jgi:mRNA interferase RelE/StbE
VSTPGDQPQYPLHIARPAVTPLTDLLPVKIAHAAYEFITGTLLDNPHRVGKPLGPPLSPAYSVRRGDYRILYLIDDVTRTVIVTAVRHRTDAY